MEQHVIPYAKLEFGRLLGKGQFGAVYKGTLDSQEVAIKKIAKTDEDNLPVEENLYLQREIEILHSLRHPHVLRFRGISQEKDFMYIITEYAEGGDLRNYLKKNEPSWEQRLAISIQIAQAIGYLHSRSIVHRDIKTENVLMDGKLMVKLADFGFAREVDPSAGNHNLTFCGSEFFEAPEIMFCMEYDERIDIFSYGMVVCEIISRKQPSMQVFKRVVPGFGVDPEEIKSHANPGCPENLLRLACECCNDEPDRRPELVMAISELKVAYNEITGKEYVDEKDPEQVKMEQQREIQRRLEEEEEWELLEAEKNGSAVQVQVHPVLSLVTSKTMKLKKRDSKITVDVSQFKKNMTLTNPIKEAPAENPGLHVPTSATTSTPNTSTPNKRRLSFGTKRPSEEPELIRIGRQLLIDKYTQAKKEDQEAWNKFVIGFTRGISVSDKQVRVLGRIKTYRKCFTSEDVLDCINELEPDVKAKGFVLELADLLVKLSFFFPVVGGNSFKEGALYRFHADEAKFQDTSKPKTKSFLTGTRPTSEIPKSLKKTTSPLKN